MRGRSVCIATLPSPLPAPPHPPPQAQSTCFELAGVSDAEDYLRTRRALSVIGVPPEEQEAAMGVVAAVLHLGNIEIEGLKDGDASQASYVPGGWGPFLCDDKDP